MRIAIAPFQRAQADMGDAMTKRFIRAGSGFRPRSIRHCFRLRLAAGRVLRAALLATLVWVGSSAVAWAQNPPAGESKEAPVSGPRVAVGEINGIPGAGLMIPLYFTPDPKNPMRSITVDIDYVSNSLKFQKASRGVVTEQVGADVSATLTDGKPDSRNLTRSKLRIAVAIPDKEPKQGLPEGLLAYLLFNVTTEAKAFAIKLNTAVVSAETTQNPPQKVAKVNAAPGLVVIELPDMVPEATCFFFTH